MVIVFGVVVASWAAGRLVSLVPVGDMSSRGDFVDMFHKGEASGFIFFHNLFVCGPIDCGVSMGVPSKLGLNVFEIFR